jgi:hypothetical protein
MVVGQARDGGHESAEAFRAALRRLFDGFELIGPGSYGRGAKNPWQGESPTIDGYTLLPHLADDGST